MKFFKNFLPLLAATGVTFFTFQVLAHDAWVEPIAGATYRILYGHKTSETYKASKVTSLKVLDANQRPLTFSRLETKEGVTIKAVSGTPALFALEYDNGYWVKVGNKSRNVPQSQIPAGTDASHPLKFSKTILSWQPWVMRPLGQRIELVPLLFKETPKAGTQLQLQLLLDGKPLGGQLVENNSNEQGPKTDSEGKVTVTVVKGVNRFSTEHNISQTNDPDAQRLSLTSALVFMAK